MVRGHRLTSILLPAGALSVLLVGPVTAAAFAKVRERLVKSRVASPEARRAPLAGDRTEGPPQSSPADGQTPPATDQRSGAPDPGPSICAGATLRACKPADSDSPQKTFPSKLDRSLPPLRHAAVAMSVSAEAPPKMQRIPTHRAQAPPTADSWE